MTFADDTLELARNLGRLLSDGSRHLDPSGLEVALVARSATLELAWMLHRDVVGPRSQGAGVTVAHLEASPVLAFGRLLARNPRIAAAVSPTDTLATAHFGVASTWAAVARSAVAALDEWPAGHGARLGPDEAWGVLADNAAIVEAITTLDGDLSAAAEGLGKTELAPQLHATHISGLRSAAAAVRAQAAAGPLPEQPVDVTRAERPRVVIVRDVESAVLAQRNLGVLLMHARHVRPQHAIQVAVAHTGVARTLTEGLLSGSMKRPEDEELAARVSDLIEPLARAASRPGRVASLDVGDPRPLQQASELARFVSNQAEQVRAARPDQLMSWVSALSSSVQALAQRASVELNGRRWLVPDTRDEAVTVWGPSLSRSEVPVLLAATHEASRLVAALPGKVPTRSNRQGGRASLVAHQGLAALLESRQPSRPHLPGRAVMRSRRP